MQSVPHLLHRWAVEESNTNFIVFPMLGDADIGCFKCRFFERRVVGEGEASQLSEMEG